MNNRLEDVKSYNLFDTETERELDEITELASIICGTPISLITILDDKRQWFKCNVGLNATETNIDDSFCQHALHNPDEVLVIENALEDERFVNNKLVVGDPNIRFYAGAPLVTKKNNVLGTLCIIDKKPRKFLKEQERALEILANKAMDRIESLKLINRLTKTIDFNTERLVNLTEKLPIGLFELLISSTGDLSFNFLSKGITKLHPEINLENWLKDPTIGFSVIHQDDIEGFQRALNTSVNEENKLYHEYRVKHNNEYHWHAINGTPIRQKDGNTIMYGSFSDVTHHFEYQSALEQISFDISHVLRRPVTTMLGITNLLESEANLSHEQIIEYSGYLKAISKELEEFTQELNEVYSEKKTKISCHNNTYKQ
ncbi:GAF domain-containing protein [Dokdonia sp. Hel_I_53]|uniref:GAF domain-containing protein n=1 Tax=Dokdonia sp. Hel_I_53 TaxID=1566287 RepID=UPI00119AB24C|nr:GAF domain-containing protein [Dokdonia sp. Hel_I_53]TVZ51362.1 GAF domain-containing protein [Dokdonia sp. Hel_I_53]